MNNLNRIKKSVESYAVTSFIGVVIIVVINFIPGVFSIVFGGNGVSVEGLSMTAYFAILITCIVMGALTSTYMRQYMQFSVSRKEALITAWIGLVVFFITSIIIFLFLYLVFDRKEFDLNGSMTVLGLSGMVFFLGIGYFFSGLFTLVRRLIAGLTIPAFIALNVFTCIKLIPRQFTSFFVSNFSMLENGMNFGNIPYLFFIYGAVLCVIGTICYFVKPSQMKSIQIA